MLRPDSCDNIYTKACLRKIPGLIGMTQLMQRSETRANRTDGQAMAHLGGLEYDSGWLTRARGGGLRYRDVLEGGSQGRPMSHKHCSGPPQLSSASTKQHIIDKPMAWVRACDRLTEQTVQLHCWIKNRTMHSALGSGPACTHHPSMRTENPCTTNTKNSGCPCNADPLSGGTHSSARTQTPSPGRRCWTTWGRVLRRCAAGAGACTSSCRLCRTTDAAHRHCSGRQPAQPSPIAEPRGGDAKLYSHMASRRPGGASIDLLERPSAKPSLAEHKVELPGLTVLQRPVRQQANRPSRLARKRPHTVGPDAEAPPAPGSRRCRLRCPAVSTYTVP